MADHSNQPIIIIRRKKKAPEEPHHGGSWKVAYADFITAMMAFFLLLWLLNVTTVEQRKGISNYFAPEAIARSTTGSGDILSGRTLTTGEMANAGGSIAIPIDPAAPTEEEEAKKPPVEEDINRQIEKREDQQFREAEDSLKQAIESAPELKQLAQNLMVDRTPEGLRIQIVDQGRYSMFPSGSAAMYDYARRLHTLVARVVQKMPNRISVTGHTDSTPFSTASTYGNWELSTDRANASRRALIEAGLNDERIARVTGKAEKEPLFSDNPADPRNRRISIVLLRDAVMRLHPN